MTTYRYTGDSVTVALVDGAPFPLDPARVYEGHETVVVARPELFVASEAAGPAVDVADLIVRIDELEGEVEVLQGALLDTPAPVPAAPVEDATAEPGSKRTRTRTRG